MKRYKPVFNTLVERRLSSWKAWYNPESNKLIQFNPNMIHSEIAEEELYMEETDAIKSGYYRIFVGHEVAIDSWKEPTQREFKAVQYMIEENSYKKFTDVGWQIYNRNQFWKFPKLSFLFADNLKDGVLTK